ncbi:Zn(II)2Cys6 transcription factor [Aspergillus sclerotiicarbonarius CBS 121057]|uniref:Zn(II)2Cys6 transcription factor n=1 Tax=Aspergillus sclerotiicarbonarius (strain CBS 121057 / IBT 28362) TaxID=1448318 RepID=A0A319DVS6_ASPSB|nr:Zn(II)2Cys6 transcription factor [Aspergillus sclerotiicarbonarius CBS 121057]
MASTSNSTTAESTDARDHESPQDDTYAAPYGSSCVNCSHAKCKCIYSKTGGKCQRCQRLDKECRPSPTRRLTTRKANVSKNAPKTSRLEDKLDDLVSMLRAGVPPGNISTTMLKHLAQPSENHKPTASNAASPLGLSDTSMSSSRPSSVYAPRSNGAAPTPEASIVDGGSLSSATPENEMEPTGVQAEGYLTFFITQMLPFFPCMYIPPGTTAQKLHRDRPFSWLCIMAVSSKISAQRRLLFDRIKRIAAQRLVHEYSCRDLDILQGLLIYLGWSNQQVYNKANIYVFAQLATGIVYEMGLFNPEAKGKHMLLCVHTEPHENRSAPPRHIMEERRAVLGCFLLTSIIATFLQQSDSLRWTSHMDECLRLVEEQQECINDGILVQQVRLQLVMDKLSLGRWYGGSKSIESMRPSPTIYLRPMQTQLQSQLQAIMSRLSSHSKGYKIVLLHHYNTSLTLHESALTKGAIASMSNVTFEHLDYLYGCLDATKSWFDIFLSISPMDYFGFPFAIFSQMVQNLATLYQLSTLESPLWDTANVRRTADVLQILDTIVANMGQVAALNSLVGDPGGDIFSTIAQTYHAVRVGWETRLESDPGSNATNLVPSLLVPSLPVPDPLADAFPPMDDNDWLSDMLNTMDQANND